MCFVFCHSEAGGHEENEDAFDVRRHPHAPSCWLCALADGQGGQAGGAEAARIACRVVVESVLARPAASAMITESWVEAIRSADQQVLAASEAGYTTLVGFAVAAGRIIGASSGDSALWFWGADGLAVDLTADQAKNPPVGSGRALATAYAAKLPPRWVVLAMSDGVWKYAGRDGIRNALREWRGQQLLDALLSRARLPRTGGLQDDFTAVLLQENAS